MGKEQELLEAARNGSISIVEKILNHRIKISGPLASLRRGPGPNTHDSTGYTGLHYAALNGHKDIVALLLKYGANPNIVDNNGSTALHLASWRGNYDISFTILTQSSIFPNVNLKNNRNEIPLHSAAQYGYAPVVSLLLQYGSDASIRNNKLESPLDLACLYGRYETVDILLQNRPDLIHDLVEKHSPLHLAAQNGHRDVAQLLLNAKFNVNYVTEKGTALHEAALSCKLDVIELLLNYGINIELENNKKQTVLDLLDDLNTNTSITKKIKHIIKDHSTLIKTEDDFSTVINPSSIILPPSEFSNVNKNEINLLNQKWPFKNCKSHPNFHFKSPSLPKVNNTKSFERSDDYQTPENEVSHYPDSMLNKDTSFNNHSFESDINSPNQLQEHLKLSQISKSVGSSHMIHSLTVYQQKIDPENSNDQNLNIDQSTNKTEKYNTQSFSKIFTNCFSKSLPSKVVKPLPPAKPPRKPVELLQHRQQVGSNIQPQLSISKNNEELNESDLNDFSNYENSNILSESSFSAFYDQIANESFEIEPNRHEIKSKFKLNDDQSEKSKSVLTQRHTRSKSEHHPYCPNFGQKSVQNENLTNILNSKKISSSFENINDPPSAATAEEGIFSVISSIFQREDICNKACSPLINGQPHSILIPYKFEENPKPLFDHQSDSSSSSNESQEYKRFKNKDCSDNETCTDESLFPVSSSNGNNVYVKVVRKSKSASKSTDFDSIFTEPKNNSFEGLLFGSISSKNSAKPLANHKSTKCTLNKNTLEKRKKNRNSKSKSTIISQHNIEMLNDSLNEIKSNDTAKTNYSSDIYTSPFVKFDQNKKWNEITNIMASFDNTSNGNKETVIKSVEDWLTALGLEKYSQLLIDNGFDDINFMSVIEDTDLIEIGITNEEDRKKLLNSFSKLPKIKVLNKETNLKVDDWLKSINLLKYYKKFKDKDYNDMNKVRQIWEVELDTVLKITKIGHQKRILASLGEKLTILSELEFDLDFNKLNFNSFFLDENNEKENINLRAKQSCSEINSQIITDYESDAMSITSDSRTDNMGSTFSLNKNNFQSLALLSPQWKHDPSELHKGHCDYKVNYLGVTLVTHLQGIQSTQEAIKKIKEAKSKILRNSEVIISISCSGVEYFNAQTNELLCKHEIRNIHCACQGGDDLKDFAYITKDIKKAAYFCHVFSAKTLDLSNEIILTLGQAFQIVYQLTMETENKSLNEEKSTNFKPPSPPPRTSSYSLSHMPNSNKLETFEDTSVSQKINKAEPNQNSSNNLDNNCNQQLNQTILEKNSLNSSTCNFTSKVPTIKSYPGIKPIVPRKPDYLKSTSSNSTLNRKVK